MPKQRWSIGGPHQRRRHGGKVFRGSRKRLRRVTWRQNMSVDMWIFVAYIALMLIVGLPRMLKQASKPSPHQAAASHVR